MEPIDCPECNGRGTLYEFPQSVMAIGCEFCGGEGKLSPGPFVKSLFERMQELEARIEELEKKEDGK